MGVKTKYELDRRLSILDKKETQKQQLEYEIDLIKKDCVDMFHDRGYYQEICELVSIHDAWLTQPKKITHTLYEHKHLKTAYHWFMYWIQKKIFDDVIWDVKFYDKLVITGYGCVSIDVPFKYKGAKFIVRIPNIQSIQNFKDMMSFGFYGLIRKTSDYTSVEFARFYTCDELKQKLKDLLDKEIENGTK